MFLPTQKNDPELYPYRRGLYFAFFNALNWQVATGTPTVLFMAYLGADSFQTGLVYGWTLLLTPVQVLATVLLPRLGFKRLTMAGWGARSWFLLVPLVLALLARQGTAPWMISAMVAAMFFYSLSRSVGAAAITTWLQGLVPESVRGRYWSTDQIMGGTASILGPIYWSHGVGGSRRVAVFPNTQRTGPNNHCSRSTVCTPWFISAPPPSRACLPRHPESR